MSESQIQLFRFYDDRDAQATRKLSIQEQFEAFHKANPWVMTELLKIIRGLVQRGHKKIGIGMVFEVLRWQFFMATSDPSGWKLNNNYRSRYARLIEQHHPDLSGIFEFRALKSK